MAERIQDQELVFETRGIHSHECAKCHRTFDCNEANAALCDAWCGFCNDAIRDLSDETRLSRAISKARGDIRSDGDMQQNIDFLNRAAKLIKGATRG